MTVARSDHARNLYVVYLARSSWLSNAKCPYFGDFRHTAFELIALFNTTGPGNGITGTLTGYLPERLRIPQQAIHSRVELEGCLQAWYPWDCFTQEF